MGKKRDRASVVARLEKAGVSKDKMSDLTLDELRSMLAYANKRGPAY